MLDVADVKHDAGCFFNINLHRSRGYSAVLPVLGVREHFHRVSPLLITFTDQRPKSNKLRHDPRRDHRSPVRAFRMPGARNKETSRFLFSVGRCDGEPSSITTANRTTRTTSNIYKTNNTDNKPNWLRTLNENRYSCGPTRDIPAFKYSNLLAMWRFRQICAMPAPHFGLAGGHHPRSWQILQVEHQKDPNFCAPLQGG